MSTNLPEPGDVVADKYVIERLLGRGGMGVVYVVTHRTTGKHLALKCLLPEYVEQPELVERFLREAQAAGRIEHRHVVDVFDAGRDGSILYIVMALLEGKSLTALLQDDTLTLEETLGILVRAMDGVAAAHAHGIVHRDLKPDNIFVCVGPSGRLDDPRVLDFGISKLEDDAIHSLTQSGMMMGTPYYMSYEQMKSLRDLDQRVDVYAMGVILYEALSGELPYMAESPASLAIRMATEPARHLGELRPDLPRALCDIAMKAIARERDERYPTMQALIDAVRPFSPLGAGSIVAAGQGTPLRSSRVSQLQAFSTGPTETPSPKAQELLRTQQSERSALQTQTDREPSPRRVAAKSIGIGSIAIVSCSAVVVLALVWWWSQEDTSRAAQPDFSLPTPAAAVGSAVDLPRAPAAEAPIKASGSSAVQVTRPTPNQAKRSAVPPAPWRPSGEATEPPSGADPAHVVPSAPQGDPPPLDASTKKPAVEVAPPEPAADKPAAVDPEKRASDAGKPSPPIEEAPAK